MDWDVLELRVLARHATAHVVHPAELTPPLKETDEEDDLALSGKGQVVPLLRRGSLVGHEAVEGEWEWEVDAIALHNVPHEGSHRHPTMLDLSVAEETVRGLIALRPEVGRAEADGVKVADGGVELLGELLLGHHQHRRGGRLHGNVRHRGRHEGRGGRQERQHLR